MRYYGQWMRDEAERRIGHLYPKATLSDGSQATVIAWLWARTVRSPDPAAKGAISATRLLVHALDQRRKKGLGRARHRCLKSGMTVAEAVELGVRSIYLQRMATKRVIKIG